MSNAIEHAKESLTRASLDACVKCTICETQCPVSRVTPEFPGPKYVGPQAERFRHGAPVDHSLDYCSGCGICTTVCPQGVKIAEINGQARAVMKEHNTPLRDRLITQTELEGKLLTPFAPIANFAMKNKPIRKIAEAVVGVHADAPTPEAKSETFMSWFKRHKKEVSGKSFPKGPVIFFHGCAGGYFETQTSRATVEESGQACCGIAGTYGLKKEKYDVAQKVGKPLFDMIVSTNPNLAACDTETCRWQIRKGSGAEVVHPIELIHKALGLAE